MEVGMTSPTTSGHAALVDHAPNLLSLLQTRAAPRQPPTSMQTDVQQQSQAADSAPEQAPSDQLPTSVPMDTSQQQQIVENIRQVEFGIGIQLDAQGANLRERQNERLGRALHRLSQDLYSKDVHFVLELVQNADDNTYQADVAPALEFILDDVGITILNNELNKPCVLASVNNLAACIAIVKRPSCTYIAKLLRRQCKLFAALVNMINVSS